MVSLIRALFSGESCVLLYVFVFLRSESIWFCCGNNGYKGFSSFVKGGFEGLDMYDDEVGSIVGWIRKG